MNKIKVCQFCQSDNIEAIEKHLKTTKKDLELTFGCVGMCGKPGWSINYDYQTHTFKSQKDLLAFIDQI